MMNMSKSQSPASHPVELLAPAGEPEAAYAAFHYGADAVYVGLRKFSARAEAVNATPEELDAITAYAHSLQPRRRVFVTVNTLVLDQELPQLIDSLGVISDVGVDAVIVQDLGVYRILHRYFPELSLHASTQMAVHNLDGARTLKELGFKRVTLARELTLAEVRHITAHCGIETEVFVHGALCYSYSGLCLYSSQIRNRSGNRGKCTYPCRDLFKVTGSTIALHEAATFKRNPGEGLAFSMKDLALPNDIQALREAGVSSFKIEGRKKSPLYVAVTTHYYRQLLNGQVPTKTQQEIQADLQTVFSRPFTRLYVQSERNRNVADADTVGHRGTRIGKVEAVVRGGPGKMLLRFKSSRPLELHDGLQIDLPGEERPFGFAVDRLQTVDARRQRRDVFEAPADSIVEVELPPERPHIPTGAPVYCSSSQAVKKKYRHASPKPGAFRFRHSMDLQITVSPNAVLAEAHLKAEANRPALDARQTLAGDFQHAKDIAKTNSAIQSAFEKLGDTPFQLGKLDIRNPDGLFVPVSIMNQVRRELTDELNRRLQAGLAERLENIRQKLAAPPSAVPLASSIGWAIKVDRLAYLEALPPKELSELEEIVIDISRDPLETLLARLESWKRELGQDRFRLALPILARSREEEELRRKAARLRDAGWSKWEVSNLYGWNLLGVDPSTGQPQHYPFDLSVDWPIYAMNHSAIEQILEMGAGRVTLSPEDGFNNMKHLLAAHPDACTVIVFQDTPLFISESCAFANLSGGCPGPDRCKFEQMEMNGAGGESIDAFNWNCRTVALNRKAYCIAASLEALRQAGARHLRADFVYRNYRPDVVPEIWRLVRAGKRPTATQTANFENGLA
jgi:putative protease